MRFLAENFARMTVRSALRYREFLIRDRAGKADPHGTIRLVMTRPFRGAIRLREAGSDHLTFHEILDDEVYAGILRHVPKCEYLFDLGANIGLTSCYIAGHYPGCRVFAVEPEASTYALLRENLQSVCGAAASSVQAAAWGKSAELSVLPGPNRAANMVHVAEAVVGNPAVRGMTVSELFVLSGFPRIDVIKIDVEGAEVSILAGDLDWLRVVNHIVIEFHGDSRVGSRFDDIMAASGFRVVESNWHTVLASRVVTPPGQ